MILPKLSFMVAAGGTVRDMEWFAGKGYIK
jgi:hypothetical protein